MSFIPQPCPADSGGGGGATVTQYEEDSPHISGNEGIPALVVRKDLLGTLVNADGDYTLLQVDAEGRLRITDIRDLVFATDKVDVSGSTVTINEPVTVDGAVTVSGTVTANLGTIDGAATEATLAHTKHKFQPGVRTTVASSINTVGDNTILTPASGKKLRVFWVGMSTSQNNGDENTVTVKFGAAGPAKYIWTMGNPGAFSHWEPIEGAVDEALIVDLSHTYPVKFNVTYEEV